MGSKLLTSIVKKVGEESMPNMLELGVSIITKSPMDFVKNMIAMKKSISSISDTIFWTNFYTFIDEGDFDNSLLYKLSERLEESGNKYENAMAIIYAVNRIDDIRKAKYISWLTVALINSEIEFDLYFKILKTIENVTYSDLVFLSDSIERIRINNDDEHIDDFLEFF